MMASKINQFPSEVLLRIFQYATDEPGMEGNSHSGSRRRVRRVRQYHLVCKQWRKAALSVLYKTIPLGKSSALLARTLRKNPHYGAYVKEVTTADNFLSTYDAYGTMNTILKLCPNIESILVEELKVTEILYPCLVQDHVQLKYLKKLTVYDAEGEDHFQNVMGPFVLLKFCKTLQQLSFRVEEASPNRISESRRHFLVKHIKKFVELEHLTIDVIAEITDAVFDQLLDDCSAKVKTLATDSFWMPEWRKPLENVKPQTTLESIRIEEHADLTVSALRYFAHKLTGLKELYIREAIAYPQPNEEKDWWTYLLNMGEHLDKLTFSTRFSQTGHAQYQLEKLAELGACMNRGKTDKTLYINFDEKESPVLGAGIFEMQIREDISFDSNPQFGSIRINACKSTDALQWLKQYAPNEMMVSDIKDMKEYCRMDFSELDKRTFFTDISNGKSYTVLTKVFENFGENLESLAIFDAVFCGISLAPLAPLTWDILNLRIGNSVVSEEFLQEVSTKVPQLDTLALEKCSFITEDPYQLKLFLPTTRLNKLVLILSAFSQVAATSLASLLGRMSAPTELSQMDNSDLMAAVSDSGRYTLKIETATKTHVLIREGNKTVSTQDTSDDTLQGTKDNFLIWIKCEDLKAFQISPKKNNRMFAEPTYEYL